MILFICRRSQGMRMLPSPGSKLESHLDPKSEAEILLSMLSRMRWLSYMKVLKLITARQSAHGMLEDPLD